MKITENYYITGLTSLIIVTLNNPEGMDIIDAIIFYLTRTN